MLYHQSMIINPAVATCAVPAPAGRNRDTLLLAWLPQSWRLHGASETEALPVQGCLAACGAGPRPSPCSPCGRSCDSARGHRGRARARASCAPPQRTRGSSRKLHQTPDCSASARASCVVEWRPRASSCKLRRRQGSTASARASCALERRTRASSRSLRRKRDGSARARAGRARQWRTRGRSRELRRRQGGSPSAGTSRACAWRARSSSV